MEYEDMKKLPKVYVRAYTLSEAQLIMKAMMRVGFEGVQNDSYRYCDLCASNALKSGECYILNGSYSIYVSNIHDKRTRKGRKEVSRSKFLSILGIEDDFKLLKTGKYNVDKLW